MLHWRSTAEPSSEQRRNMCTLHIVQTAQSHRTLDRDSTLPGQFRYDLFAYPLLSLLTAALAAPSRRCVSPESCTHACTHTHVSKRTQYDNNNNRFTKGSPAIQVATVQDQPYYERLDPASDPDISNPSQTPEEPNRLPNEYHDAKANMSKRRRQGTKKKSKAPISLERQSKQTQSTPLKPRPPLP
jgi:hypothetical protein